MAKDDKRSLTPRLRFPEFRDGPEWKSELLGNICRPQQWETITTAKLSNVGFPVYGANGLIGYNTEFNHEFETVAVTCRGSTCGEVLLVPAKSYITGNSMCLDDIDDTQHSYRFLYQNLKHRGFRDIISGSAQPQIVGNAIRKLTLALPNLAEQQKIVDCLTALDAVVAAQTRKVEALKAHKKGLMQQLFPREGETLPRLRLPEFRDAPDWCVDPLGELFETTTGGTPDRAVNEYWGGSIPWITTSLVDFNVISKAEEFISEKGLENSSAKLFPKNTVLVALYGQGKTRGKVALLGIEATTNQACAAILPGDGIEPAFTFLSLSGRYDEMRELSNSGGQENLSQGLLRGLPFRYPKKVAEQQRIAECLSTLDARIAAETEKHAALKTHKRGLMEQLFPSPVEY